MEFSEFTGFTWGVLPQTVSHMLSSIKTITWYFPVSRDTKFCIDLEVSTLDLSATTLHHQEKKNENQHISIEYILCISLKRFPGGKQGSFISVDAMERGNKHRGRGLSYTSKVRKSIEIFPSRSDWQWEAYTLLRVVMKLYFVPLEKLAEFTRKNYENMVNRSYCMGSMLRNTLIPTINLYKCRETGTLFSHKSEKVMWIYSPEGADSGFSIVTRKSFCR